MGGMKKGMLFMLSVLLLSITLLYLLSSTSLYSNSLKITAASLSNIERLNAHSDSVSYQIKSIFLNGASDVDIYAMEGMNVVSVTETVPISLDYYTDIFFFKEFAEMRSELNTSVNITDALRPRLYVHPYNITIDHGVGRTVFIAEEGQGSAGSVTGYNVLLIINGTTPWINWTNITEVSAYDPSALSLHLGLQGTNGTIAVDKYLDKYSYSEMHLMDRYNNSLFVVQLEPPASLKINYNAGAVLETEIYLNDTAEEDISVELGKQILYADLEGLGEGSKKSGVFINEG